MKELRREYARTTPAQLDRLAGLVEGLQQNPDDRAALSELHRGFHTLAGSGAIFGFPEVSRLCRQAEDECATLGDEPRSGSADLGRLKGVIDAVREQLVGHVE
ncbi:MAG: hypothetical protein A3I61_10075 [Acidobacteria bacterium RIFCSPLOWO2_02_FULL_68_18]|nr:MAG: hypothetical protein A3I61_10075 [Acidobacteria bacterium RIFCSPLOWO2_02_FULL_68_18]OFW50951.1 MAG: hypothetical protein A3G77_15090 [Acidobacteria bacterium RIFCSPLOWO2_12_FULL_68_19]